MEIADVVGADAVIPHLRATSKKQTLQLLSAIAAGQTGLSERLIFETLMEREHLGSTGVGQGIAIPHGKLKELDRIVGIFARLETPVDFDAIDDQPVDIVFLLLAPKEAGADHLKALARISRLLRDRSVCGKLRGAANADTLYALLTDKKAQAA